MITVYLSLQFKKAEKDIWRHYFSDFHINNSYLLPVALFDF